MDSHKEVSSFLVAEEYCLQNIHAAFHTESNAVQDAAEYYQ